MIQTQMKTQMKTQMVVIKAQFLKEFSFFLFHLPNFMFHDLNFYTIISIILISHVIFPAFSTVYVLFHDHVVGGVLYAHIFANIKT